MSGPSLAQQLKQLHSNNVSVPDPESAYSNLDSHDIQRKGDEGREHYVDVGPSRLRMELGGTGGGTLTGPKYEGVKTGRMKIFDDDDEDEEENGGEEGSEGEGDEDEDEEDEGDEDEGDEEYDEDEDEEGESEDEGEEEQPQPRANGSKQALDPVASLRNSRLKDVEKGQAIRKQKVGSIGKICPLQTNESPRLSLNPSSPSVSLSRKPSLRPTPSPPPFPKTLKTNLLPKKLPSLRVSANSMNVFSL